MVQANHIHCETPRPSLLWLSRSDQENLAIVQKLCLAALEVHGIEIIVGWHNGPDQGLTGQNLRNLECSLRIRLEEPIEVYCELRKDQNQPRDPLTREKIIGWLRARERMKMNGGVDAHMG